MSDYTPDVEHAMEKAYYDEAYEEAMTDRIQLGKHTWIENGYCYTTSHEVAAAWKSLGGIFLDDACQWSIPVSALPEVYGYRENEPFVWVTEFVYVGHEAERDMDIDAPMLHLRAVIPCGGSADSFRALFEEVRNDHGE